MNWRCANTVDTVGLLLDNSKYHLAHRLPKKRFYGVCGDYAYADFFTYQYYANSE